MFLLLAVFDLLYYFTKTSYMVIYSQMTPVSFNAFGDTEALSCIDVAYVSMVVTVAYCREKGREES